MADTKRKITKHVKEDRSPNVITVKVELHLIKEGTTDEEKKKYTNQVYSDLRTLERDTYQGFNKLLTRTHLIKSTMKGIPYGTKDSPERESYLAKLNEVMSALGIDKDEYKLITKNGEFSGFAQTASSITQKYNKSSSFEDYTKGIASLPSFKKGCPIPLNKQGSKLTFDEDSKLLVLRIPKNYRFELNKKLSSDRVDHLKNCIQGKDGYKLGDPSIQLKENKLYLLQPITIPKKDSGVDENIVAGIDLGINTPIVFSLGTNTEDPKKNRHAFIGHRNDFLRVRNSIARQHRNAQRNNMAQGGKGRGHKLKALERFKEKEVNFTTTYCHVLSSKVIAMCVENRVGTLHMENLSGFGDNDRSKDWVLRNWSYFQLQTMIKYKAKKEGIRVLFVDPAYTSQTCCNCGHVDRNNRYDPSDKTKFKCTGCGYEMNADLNGAINIARSTRFVVEEEIEKGEEEVLTN